MHDETTLVAGPESDLREQEAVRLFLLTPSEETFTPLFHCFAPRMLRYFGLRGCDQSVAEDLTQEVMLAAYRLSGTIRDAQRFRAWLYGIGRNKYLMHLRMEDRGLERVELESLSDTLHAAAVDPYSRSVLYESLAMLDPVSRRILVMRYLDGLEYHELAEVLDMPLGTVQWKLFDTKKKLARWLIGK
jgi:RNA polymerase sigma-70 factor (ECF subfamily)